MNKTENAVIKYQVDFEKFKNGQANAIIELLDNASSEIAKYIKKTTGVYTKERYKEIAKKLKEISASLKKNVESGIDVDGVIDYELKKQSKILDTLKNDIMKVKNVGNVNFLYPSVKQIKTEALFKPITSDGYGMTWESFLNGIENGFYNTWDIGVRTGYLTGQTTQQIVKSVVGGVSKIDKLSNPGSITSLRNSVYSNTRTALQALANETQRRVYEENEKYFGGGSVYKYEYLACLDSHTCLVCGADDGRLYKTLKEAPTLPRHRGDRCMIIPYYDIEGDTRASKDGQVDAKLTFNDWLKEQDEATQKEVLGRTRYEKWKSGEVKSIDQYVENGKTLNLEDLEKTLNQSQKPKNIKLYSDINPKYIKPQDTDFTEVENAFNKIGISITDGVKKEDIRAVSEVYNALSEVSKDVMKFNKIGVAELDNNVLMQTFQNGTLVLNKKLFSNYEQLEKIIKNANNMPKNASLKSLVMHEVGHNIESTIASYVYKDKADFDSAWTSGEIARQILQKTKNELKLTLENYKNQLKNISYLATKNDISETFAECFNDFYANGKNANIVSKTVERIALDLLDSVSKGDNLWLKL